VPLTAAKTKEAMESTKRNPKNKVKGRRVVSVVLIFEGVEFDPSGLYNALDTQYGTVATDKDTMGRNNYEFRITP
jgi:hypothetical protein